MRHGDSPEAKAWNREYASLVAEYLLGLEQQDEGFAGERLAEIRKTKEGLLRNDKAVVDATKQEVRHRRYGESRQE